MLYYNIHSCILIPRIWLLLTLPVDQDPLSEEKEALFVKIDQSLLGAQVQSPKVVLHCPSQGMMMNVVHPTQATYLLKMGLGMVGEMGLTTVTALLDQGVEVEVQAQSWTGTAVKLMVLAQGMIGAPLTMMMMTLVQGAASHLEQVFVIFTVFEQGTMVFMAFYKSFYFCHLCLFLLSVLPCFS